MNTSIVKACQADLAAIGRIYEDIIARQEQGGPYVGWQRGVYPTEDTARAALARGDLFVQRREGKVTGAAIINQIQVDVYRQAAWQYPAPDEQVMVLHALVIDPAESGRGLGREFVGYYEAYAAEKGCPFCAWTPTPKISPPGRYIKSWVTGRSASCPAYLTA